MELYFTLYSLYLWAHYTNLDSEICSRSRSRRRGRRIKGSGRALAVKNVRLRNSRIDGNRGYFCSFTTLAPNFYTYTYALNVCVCTVGFASARNGNRSNLLGQERVYTGYSRCHCPTPTLRMNGKRRNNERRRIVTVPYEIRWLINYEFGTRASGDFFPEGVATLG